MGRQHHFKGQMNFRVGLQMQIMHSRVACVRRAEMNRPVTQTHRSITASVLSVRVGRIDVCFIV